MNSLFELLVHVIVFADPGVWRLIIVVVLTVFLLTNKVSFVLFYLPSLKWMLWLVLTRHEYLNGSPRLLWRLRPLLLLACMLWLWNSPWKWRLRWCPGWTHRQSASSAPHSVCWEEEWYIRIEGGKYQRRFSQSLKSVLVDDMTKVCLYRGAYFVLIRLLRSLPSSIGSSLIIVLM